LLAEFSKGEISRHKKNGDPAGAKRQ